MLHTAPIHHLLQRGARVSLETGRVCHGSHRDLWRSHHPNPSHHGGLRVQVERVPGCAVQGLKLNPVGLVEERCGGRVLDQRQVVPRVVLLENLLAESDEEDDEGDDDKKHHSDPDQLLFTDHGVTRLHVGDDDGPQATALAHEARCAVTVEGTVSVDADAAVLTLALRITTVTFVHIFLTAAGWRDGGKRRRDWCEINNF